MYAGRFRSALPAHSRRCGQTQRKTEPLLRYLIRAACSKAQESNVLIYVRKIDVGGTPRPPTES